MPKPQGPTGPKKNVRSYKGELPPQVKLEPESEFTGVFQDAKEQSIFDKEKQKDKDVMVYTFTDPDGKKVAILGRSNLDRAFETVFEREGGIARCQGLTMRVIRGKNSKVPGTTRIMGNYEIEVWED